MKCTSCGAELAPDDKFCGECGAPRPEVPPPIIEAERPEAEPPPAPVVAAPEPEAPPTRKRSAWKWVAAGCIGLLAVACILAGLAGAWLGWLLYESQELTIDLPELPLGEATATPLPTATWTPTPPPPFIPTPSIEPAVVLAYCSAFEESPVYVRENQPVIIYWGWAALTQTYVQDFLDTAMIEVLLDGQEIRPEMQTGIEYDSEEEGYVVGWSTSVGTLTPGSHRVDYHISWTRQISDGWYTYGPGGEYEEEREHCEIVVQ